MIETEYTKLEVTGDKDEVCLRIEDKDADESYGYLNLCWLNETQLDRLIKELQTAKRRLEEHRVRTEEIIRTVNISKMYAEFEERYNEYPVQMSRAEAFGRALNDGLIDQDTYDAAYKVYKRLWNYVGD